MVESTRSFPGDLRQEERGGEGAVKESLSEISPSPEMKAEAPPLSPVVPTGHSVEMDGARAAPNDYDSQLPTIHAMAAEADHVKARTTDISVTPLPEMRRLGRFQIIRELGQGGYGVVYQAFDSQLRRMVALKIPRPQVQLSRHMRQRFEREAQAAAGLEHPNIVPVYEVSVVESVSYIVSAFVEGVTLDQWARQQEGVAPFRHSAMIIAKVAEAIHYTHLRGILHRDLKPTNILLEKKNNEKKGSSADFGNAEFAWVPRVTDFGLAKLTDSSMEVTQTGAILGTPPYMAPEQTEGRTDLVGPETDVWSMGVILYELVTGQRPFTGIDQSVLFQQIQNSEPPKPRSVVNAVPRPLETIILKCLEKDPLRRYRTAQALADDLGRWRAGESILARPEPAPRRWWRRIRQQRWISTAAAGVALIALTLFVVDYWTDPERLPLELAAKLHRREPITLIGETGGPVWWRRRTGEANAPILVSTDKPFRLSTATTSLLELLPEVPYASYRLRAEIRHDLGWPFPSVACAGIYVCGLKEVNSHGPEHLLHLILFADRGYLADAYRQIALLSPISNWCFGLSPYRISVPTLGIQYGLGLGRIEMEARRLVESEPMGVSLNMAARTLSSPYWLPAEDEPAAWHSLIVEVNPNVINIHWDGKLVGTRPADVLAGKANTLIEKRMPWTVVPQRLAVHGSIGLFVDKSIASFRRVTLEPID